MMKRNLVENLLVAGATLVFGVMAGFFWTYTFNINRAMLAVDGATYATMQSLLNVNVRHPMFFLFFFGGGAFSLVALLANFRHWRTPAFWLLAVAFLVYFFGIIFFTQQVNLPLNAYTESWNPADLPLDWQQVREQWNSANAIRVGTSLGAFALGLLALVSRSNRPIPPLAS
ncbi:MAG: DUF1772 domain-containing protein [Anaerolineales bacterium]|nr:DUF1772 domain-containing protein [Anaerolineales bacterium]